MRFDAKSLRFLFFVPIIVLLLSSSIPRSDSQAAASPEPVVQVSTAWPATGVLPGGEITLAVVLDIRPPYHLSSDQAQPPFIPTSISVVDPPGDMRVDPALFPPAHDLAFDSGDGIQHIPVFEKRALIQIPLRVASTAKPGERMLRLRIEFQACDDRTCLLPEERMLSAVLNVVESAAIITRTHQDLFEQAQSAASRVKVGAFGWEFSIASTNLLLLLLVAAFGGFLLNFTPCVLPLIPIKIIGLSQAATQRRRCLILGVALGVGVVAFWLGLALAVSLVTGFAANRLFQFPAFTMSVGIVIVIMAVGMCGLFNTRVPQWVYRIQPSQKTVAGSFLFGVMTAVLSTPCTAPFMGTAAAWSATQPPVITLATFASIGVGMAWPYLVLSAFPGLVKRMPKTGPASELIKQVMGLLMLAAGAYFLGTGWAGVFVEPPDPPFAGYWWAVGLFVALAGAWLGWRTLRLIQGRVVRSIGVLLSVGLIWAGLALGYALTRTSPVRWVYYTPERLDQARAQGRVIVLEFTAAWCLNCETLERAVLHHAQIVDLLNSDKVIPIKVDLTGKNKAGNELLIQSGRRTIPFLIVYSASGKPVFESDAYTVAQLAEAIRGNF